MTYSIADFLEVGESNIKTTTQLVNETGLSERSLRKAVHDERLQGTLIVSTTSGQGGYYLANTKSELEHFLHSQEKRARCSFASIKRTREALKQIDGQIALGTIQEV